MPGPFSQIYQPQNSSVYAPIDIGAVNNAFKVTRDRYDKVVDDMSKFQMLSESLDVGDNEDAQAIKNAALANANKEIEQYVKKGNYEDAQIATRRMATKFASDPMLQSVVRGFEEHKKVKDFQLANEGRYIDFNPYGKHKFYNEDGTLNPYSSATEGQFDYTKEKTQLLGLINSLSGNLGLTTVETKGLEHYITYGEWSGIKPERGKELMRQLADYYINNTTAGDQELRMLTKPNNKNNFDPENVLDKDTAVDKITNSMLQLGKGLLGISTKMTYGADPLAVANTKNKDKGGPPMTAWGQALQGLYETGRMNIPAELYQTIFGKQINASKVIVSPGQNPSASPAELEEVEKAKRVRRIIKNSPMSLEKVIKTLNPIKEEDKAPVEGSYLRNSENIGLGAYTGFKPDTSKKDKENAEKIFKELAEELGITTLEELLPAYKELNEKASSSAKGVLEDSEYMGLNQDKLGNLEFVPSVEKNGNTVMHNGVLYIKGKSIGTNEQFTGAGIDIEKAKKSGLITIEPEGTGGTTRYSLTTWTPTKISPELGSGYEKAYGTASNSAFAASESNDFNRMQTFEASKKEVINEVFGTNTLDAYEIEKIINEKIPIIQDLTKSERTEFESEINRVVSLELFNFKEKIGRPATKEEAANFLRNHIQQIQLSKE